MKVLVIGAEGQLGRDLISRFGSPFSEVVALAHLEVVEVMGRRDLHRTRALLRIRVFVADNGIDWAISVAPDPRIGILHEELRRVKGEEFEVVVTPQ